ncbi:ATP-binding protein [Rahnella woolbedingensis]|uniref:histidine kinase n=1 Tax=Rahnella woolbedingensis TaxID=1510574 RepID=A0A419NEZ9_9GAMM|nr:sensor histidine kinase [Rahnella woolbedingensis]RJT47520.1 sensor histidine kinase [Rahnella woolbedingensis]
MWFRLSFQIKLFIYLVVLFVTLFSGAGIYYYQDVERQLYEDLGMRAKVQAEEIALIPSLIREVENKDISQINRLMSNISAHSDASYMVIGDSDAMHLFHSIYTDRVGQTLVGGDNAEVLAGKSITTIRLGGIGLSLRSKAPIFNAEGKVVGIVSVGYLISHINNLTVAKTIRILLAAAAVLLALFAFSWFFSRSIKKQMFSLEPRDIGLLVRQQKALMESIYEGVIAIDSQERVVVVNQAAKKLLNLTVPSRELRGQQLSQVIAAVSFFNPQVMLEKDIHDEICLFNNLTVIASRVRIMLENQLQGWVITFRACSDIDRLSIQLSQVQRYADNLRVMRHEQLNWTATLAGLLHMGRYDEAIRYIEAQSENAQEILDFVSARFCSPRLCGLLLGKYARAREKGIGLEFDPACEITRLPAALSETELMSVIGNLLDNAIEATLLRGCEAGPVEVYIVGGKDELVIEVADHGVGITRERREEIFSMGVTSKPEGDHGLGLHLVASYVSHAGGSIEVSDNPPTGAIFSVFIPIDVGASDNPAEFLQPEKRK